MSTVKKIFTLFIIFMMLFNPVLAADTGQSKEKIVDDTKEKAEKIINKDKSITGDIKVTTKDVSKFSVKKKSNYEISISKSGEHTKAKVSFPKSELQKIDIDKDGKFGLLHISDTGEVTHTTATEAELVAGKEMVFSENIVNGYSGYKEYTFSDVESGDTLNIEDVSGNYTIAAEIDGVVPTYTAIDRNNISTYPSGAAIVLPFNGNTNDISLNNNTVYNSNGYDFTYDRFGNPSSAARFNASGEYIDYISSPSLNVIGNITITVWNLNNVQTTNYNKIVVKNTSAESYFIGLGTVSDKRLYSRIITDAGNKYAYQPPGSLQTGKWNFNAFVFDRTTAISFRNQSVLSSASSSYSTITSNSGVLRISKDYNGSIDDVNIYPRALSTSELKTLYAGGSGISFQPEPSYNFTGYDVSSGVEKVLNTDATTTGIEYVDTTGGTHDVTVTVYFTEDITLVSETTTEPYQNVSIIHTALHDSDNGSIPHELVSGVWYGTPSMNTNNSNASVNINSTHINIITGMLKTNDSMYYNVSIPYYADALDFTSALPLYNSSSINPGGSIDFSVTTPYIETIKWYINGSLQQTNTSSPSNFSNTFSTNGVYNVSAVAGREDGNITKTWIITVYGFVNVPAVAVVVVITSVIGGSFINAWYRRRKNN